MEMLSRKEVKSRKEHKCMFCNGMITKGEIYVSTSLKNDGEIYTWKNHLKCGKLTGELDMDYDGEGINSDLFMEYVYEFLNSNLSEEESNDLDLWGEDAVNKTIEIIKSKSV